MQQNGESTAREFSGFAYTHENHFQIGYRDRKTLDTCWFVERSNDDQEFVARYSRRAEKTLASWRQANVLAANRILDLALQNALTPTLCYSGGLDSEVALVSFLEALATRPVDRRIAIDVVTLDFANGLNRHDTEFVERFCSGFDKISRNFAAHNEDLSALFNFRRESLDIVDFLSGDAMIARSDSTGVVVPAILTQIWLCDRIRSLNPMCLPILAQGEMHLVRDEDASGTYQPAPWSLVETENLCGLYRHFIARGEPAIPGFFQYLPEQFESQLRTNGIVHELLSHSRFGKLGTRTSKAEIIAFDYPELPARPKYTGFEKVEELYNKRRAFLSARQPVRESKWIRGVFDLMDDLRVVEFGAGHCGDWKFGWGSGDGEIRNMRTSADDIFASEWPLGSIPSATDFVSAFKANTHAPPILLHDGSLFARVSAAVFASGSAPFSYVRPSEVDQMDIPTVTRGALESRVYQPENVALIEMVRVARSRKIPHETPREILVPRMHHRIVNTEYDRELGTTLMRPRFVWTENESLAVLANALMKPQTSTTSLHLPFSNAGLRDLIVRATRASGWFELDEPGPANGGPFQKFLEAILIQIGEPDELRELANSCAREFAELHRQASEALAKSVAPRPQDQTSTFEIEFDKPTSQVWISIPRPGGTSVAWDEVFTDHPRLRVVSHARWLEQARRRAPELRLGSNLFLQQSIMGFDRLRADTRVSLSLLGKPGTAEAATEVAWAHLVVLSPAPHGRLRIRGVTTRADFSEQGYATELLTEIATRLKQRRPTGFAAIDVFAAPEVVNAFRRAGFVDDVSRVTRAEETVDPETGHLVTTDRDLMPMTFFLGEP